MTRTEVASASDHHFGLLDKERIIAPADYNRWLVPPAALAIHLCIGMAYGFSVFWLPLGRAVGVSQGLDKAIPCPGDATTFWGKVAITGHALFATDCDWTQFDLGWMFTLFFVLLGVSAAIWGGWLERVGPRKAGVVAAICWCGGLLISAVGVYVHQLWLMWLGSGIIGGIGLGLGYISPVSTLIKWFPDRRGMATGMAIMGFGGGAMIGSPLATLLMNHFATPTSVGVWETLVAMAAIYFVFMMGGAFGYRLPPTGWKPLGWTPPASAKAMITTGHVHLNDAHKTIQFWLIWLVLCLNVSAGIGIIGAASPMLQETFGGRLFGDPTVGFAQFDDAQKAKAALVGAAFVGLFSLFNIAGRFFWASLSDKIGRKMTYYTFFVLGFICYAAAPTLATLGMLGLFAAAFCLIASMYGGGFATIPAYLADIFGTQFVGAIHGRLLTAWSTAGIVGPVIVNYMHDSRKAEGIAPDQIYHPIFYVLAGLLVAGFICNLLIRPLAAKWFMKPEEVEALQTKSARDRAMHAVEIRAREETHPGIRLLQPIGLLLVAIAVVWWITFYTKQAGGIGGVWECLIYSAGPCLDAVAKAEAAGSFAYHPFLMWIGLALWFAGIVLSPRRLEVAPLAWFAVGLPLLWGIWITVDKALVLFA
ncbi:OFA family MFS transporter [Methyloceanibacter sp.]|uniref:OFA family MFS transporter n=1 Tax=Methyloceanibacter sp. TaxID=1965321 RepID=UPI002D4B1B5A|nr:OFA family MFS transporter [Methyloceanibacter sp.]HZP08586.1 OFA family MFS transporter [Methyloceanibacter sp.]